MDFKDILYRRLVKYAKVDTRSDPESKTYPSSKNQLILGGMLVKELKSAGVRKTGMDKYGYVTGEIPATVSGKCPVIGFLAHLDTSPDASGKNVKPQLHRNYGGGDIVISKKLGVVLTPKNCPELLKCNGEDIVTASGDTLLGADNKAGLAIIMTAAEYLVRHPEIKHGKIKIGFTPDEEVGQGVKYFNVKKFGAEATYTFDGDVAGAIEEETFNADGVKIVIKGKSVHPGTAKNTLANALRVAADIVSAWPENRLPETTENREGFIMFTDLKGGIEAAELSGIVRDHDLGELKAMERHLAAIAEEKRIKYPLADIKVEFKEQYRNMGPVIARRPEIMASLSAAIRKAGIEPRIKPVRGGTDGARLSFMGLPTPNVFTGGYNYHGRYEWVSLDGMNKSAEVLINLVQEWAKK
ncbi:MAG: peptidase T [Elusimicrobia bacterium GWA2_56_46]|nr:MAG: peptidase T [Elusimicrobia bacterium GWA2_56_46]OGR55953.1 MAG: peptidase T [Elusimicrobia bacterium GWC2_56_31]HBB68237.1 peptidase T [Elusimicrobiota bacterium]HBW22832.1 peptidase T [Elusimicrobiota bacterium]